MTTWWSVLLAFAAIALGSPPDPAERFERQVMEQMLDEPAGAGRVRDLQLPEDLLRRVADRRILDAFHQQVHLVRADAETAERLRGRPPIDADADPTAKPSFTIREPIDPSHAEHAEAWRQWLADQPARSPNLQGLLVPSIPNMVIPPPGPDHDAALTSLVARSLAREGLARITLRVLRQLAHQGEPLDASDHLRSALAAVGLPVDLIDLLHRTDSSPTGPIGPEEAFLPAAVRHVLKQSDEHDEVFAAAFTVQWSHCETVRRGFRMMPECGTAAIHHLRMQLTRGTHWWDQGDGGAVDLLRSLLAHLPETRIDVSIERRFIPSLIRTAAAWEGTDRLRVTPEELILSQWIRDHAAVGRLSSSLQPGTPVLLLSRYGNRGEPVGALVAGDSLALRRDHEAQTIVSPLLFQGGNLLCVIDPAHDERLLLLGEAEIHRNRMLGLSEQEILAGFQRLFGVQRLVVLSGPSFHIDFDVTIRRTGSTLTAFVHDAEHGHRLVLRAGIGALERAGRLDAAAATRARQAVNEGDPNGLNAVLGPAVFAHGLRGGGFPLTLAELFAVAETDSGIANFQRFLLAFDRFQIYAMPPELLPEEPGVRAYARAVLRARDDQRRFEAQLTQAGLEVVRVPGFSEGSRSVSSLNALHAREWTLLPVSGGLLTPVDEAARERFESALDASVRVISIPAAESLRRGGGVHCALLPLPGRDEPARRRGPSEDVRR